MRVKLEGLNLDIHELAEILYGRKSESMSKSHKSQTKDLTVDNLTPHTIKINTNIDDERVKFLFTKLIQHAHDFVREVSLKTNEWEAAWQYLTDVILLCDFLESSCINALTLSRSARCVHPIDKR